MLCKGGEAPGHKTIVSVDCHLRKSRGSWCFVFFVNVIKFSSLNSMIRFDLVGPAADSQCCKGKVGPSKRQLWMSLYLTWWWRLGIFSPNCTRSVQVPRSLRYCRRWCWARSFHSTVPTVPDMKILYRWSSTSAPLYGFRGLTLQVLCFPSSFWAFGCCDGTGFEFAVGLALSVPGFHTSASYVWYPSCLGLWNDARGLAKGKRMLFSQGLDAMIVVGNHYHCISTFACTK